MEFIKKNKTLIILLILASFCLFLSTGTVANVYIDVGREIYYPKAILEGKILYKDLFCIYGPFSYLFNALLYKIFGESLNTLYGIGTISALLIVSFVYLISKKFLSDFVSISITLFVIIIGCLATRIFNYTLPYSYAVLFGLVCFLVSLYFLIKFIENKKEKNLILASFFGGLSFINKYDFLLYIIPLTIVILKTKNWKLILKSYLSYLTPIIFSFLILFIQGLKISDLFHMMGVIKSFTLTDAMKTFYVTQGVYYTNKVWMGWFDSFIFDLFYLIFIIPSVYLFNKKNLFLKILAIIVVLICFILGSTYIKQTDYLFLTFLTLVLFVLRFNKNSFLENIVILSSLSISLKSLWGLSHVNYGIYYAPSILISFFILLKNNLNKNLVNSINIFLLVMLSSFLLTNLSWVINMQGEIKTNKGTITTVNEWGKITSDIIGYIDNIKEENPNILILPEGLIINFLTNKKNTPDGFYNSLIPLYTEGFGEENIIEHYKKFAPDYFIVTNMQTGSYDKGEICNTYAFNICRFILDNYIPIEKFEDKGSMAVIFYKGKKLWYLMILKILIYMILMKRLKILF